MRRPTDHRRLRLDQSLSALLRNPHLARDVGLSEAARLPARNNTPLANLPRILLTY